MASVISTRHCSPGDLWL